MDIRHLSSNYAVSPQIAVGDVAAVKAAGFVTVICNRPDAEMDSALRADQIRAAVEAQGMIFVLNPIVSGMLSEANIETQRLAIDTAAGPVFAYCASGNRSSVVWALSQAGRQSADALIGAAARHGYQLEGLRADLDRRATPNRV